MTKETMKALKAARSALHQTMDHMLSAEHWTAGDVRERVLVEEATNSLHLSLKTINTLCQIKPTNSAKQS